MKFSQFNTLVFYNNSHILYNAYTDSFMLLNELLRDMYVSAKEEKDPNQLVPYHPTFHKALIEKGFIVEESKDEVEAVKVMQLKVDGADTQYHLVINPTMNCNFKCWYCYESHIKDSKITTETIELIRKHIILKVDAEKIDLLRISWFGGEPLLYYNQVMLPILEFAQKYCQEHSITFVNEITTNGFLIKEEMIEGFKKYDFQCFQITLDGDRTLHDTIRFVNAKRGSYDQILGNVKLLCSSGIFVSLRVNYTAKTLNSIESILEDLSLFDSESRKKLIISFHKVWQEPTTDALTFRLREITKQFILMGYMASTGDIPAGINHSCFADKENQATINYNGDVFKCTARDFTKKNSEGVLNDSGEIVWNDNHVDRVRDVKFKNKPCLSCAILPLCNGGCSQQAIENKDKDYCMYNFDEGAKKNVVLDKFLSLAPSFR